MEFEYDPAKSAANKHKHGIDFEEAQRIWDDPDAVALPARLGDEMREIVIGRIDDICWSAIVTMRHHNIRLISVRRSRQDERDYYESI